RARRGGRRGRRHPAPPADARARDAARSPRVRPPSRNAHRRGGCRPRARPHRAAAPGPGIHAAAGSRGRARARAFGRRRCGAPARASAVSSRSNSERDTGEAPRAGEARLAAALSVAGRVPHAMSGREVDVDALFDRNADTQLLDRRRREELGLVAQLAPASSTPIRFGPESMLGDEAPQRPRAAMLRVALDARPERELIPGAVVTVVATVHDDGDAAAADVVLRIGLPAECEPLPGSFARDDVELDGDALLGEGVRLGTLAAGGAVRVRFTMRVLPGTGPLDVIAHAGSPGRPAIG